MLYRVFEPHVSIAPYVRYFWALEGDVESGGEFVHRSMADGCVEIVFHYRGIFDEVTADGSVESSPIASIQAQSTRFRRFRTDRSFGIFGAYLFPFAVPRLFGYPASDLTNISPDLASVFGPDGQLLEERVSTAGDNTERVGIVTEFLLQKAAAGRRDLSNIHRAVHSIIGANGRLDVGTLARDHFLSIRQFERKFKEFAGLSPKLYSRVVRFQAATQYKSAQKSDLTRIAYDCGYYDQSHFINDFREFSGYTPKEYFWKDAEGTQYMNA